MEKAEVDEGEMAARINNFIDNDREMFQPRPSDDPKDPLNWPLYIKVRMGEALLTIRMQLTGYTDWSSSASMLACRSRDAEHSHHQPCVWPNV